MEDMDPVTLPYSLLVPYPLRGKTTINYYREEDGTYTLAIGRSLLKLHERVLFPETTEDRFEFDRRKGTPVL